MFLSHIRFIDFREFNRTPPIWISQVRDPTERFISRYHFVRRRERQNFKTLMRKRGVLEAEKWANMSVDECVGRGLHECNLRPRQEYEPSPIVSMFLLAMLFCANIFNVGYTQCAKLKKNDLWRKINLFNQT